MLRGIARARGEVIWLRAFKALEASNGAPAAVRAAIAMLERQALEQGVPVSVVARTAGHDLSVTMPSYAHDATRRAVDALGAIYAAR